MNVTPENLRRALPLAPIGWLVALVEVPHGRWEINTPNRFAAFCGQLAHECNQFHRLTENLNYSAERLTAVWPRRFPTVEAASPYARNPEALANRVYSGRMGNGDEASGDGWRYRGRGPIQLTGKANYAAAGAALGLDLVGNPDAVLEPRIGLDVAGWYWQSRGLNALAEAGADVEITRRINGGQHGLVERRRFTLAILEVLT